MVAALGLIPPLLSAALSFAQAPPPVPALPDSERRTQYSISGTTCACSVGFALYGSGADVDSWLEVWVAGTRYLSTDPLHGWGLTSATGSLATIPRPVTDAVLTFTAVQTGIVQIVGAERPRRLSQFQENRGVAARDLNQALTDIIAQNRETWDKINDVTGRGFFAPPGSVGGIVTGPFGVISGPLPSTDRALARWNGTSGAALLNSIATLSDAGTLTLAPATGFIQGLSTNQVLSGSSLPTGAAANLFFITGDTAQAGGGFVNGVVVSHNAGGSAATGGRQSLASFLNLSTPTSASNTNTNYVALYGNAFTATGDGGTNTGGGARGGIFGLAEWSDLQSGGVNLLSVGPEFNTSIRTGGSAAHKFELLLAEHSLDAVAAATTDASLAISGQSGAIGHNTGITFSALSGQHAVKSSGTLINSTGGTFATGIDFSASTFTTAIKTAGFTVGGTGQTALNFNAAAAPAIGINQGLQINGVDNGIAGVEINDYGAAPVYAQRYANGTGATPTKVLNTNVIGQHVFRGWDASGVFSGNQAIMRAVAAEDWNDATHRGVNLIFLTTPTASGTVAQAMEVFASGGIGVGTAADPGIGSLAAANVVKHGISTVAALPTCNSAAEGARYGVTDHAAAPVYAAIVAGGGTVHIGVYCNGTNWIND